MGIGRSCDLIRKLDSNDGRRNGAERVENKAREYWQTHIKINEYQEQNRRKKRRKKERLRLALNSFVKI
jgi:hypothetical protein